MCRVRAVEVVEQVVPRREEFPWRHVLLFRDLIILLAPQQLCGGKHRATKDETRARRIAALQGAHSVSIGTSTVRVSNRSRQACMDTMCEVFGSARSIIGSRLVDRERGARPSCRRSLKHPFGIRESVPDGVPLLVIVVVHDDALRCKALARLHFMLAVQVDDVFSALQVVSLDGHGRGTP